MRRLLLGVVLLLSPAWADGQTDPRTNGIGFYFDQQGSSNCAFTTAPNQAVTLYLLATRTDSPSGIGGWECTVGITGDFVVQDWDLPYGGTNFLPFPQFAVGYGGGFPPWAPAIPLLWVTGVVASPASQVQFYLDGAPLPSIPEAPHNPVYVAANNNQDLRLLWQSTGGYDVPVASINGDCPVANATSTWGGVKSLFD